MSAKPATVSELHKQAAEMAERTPVVHASLAAALVAALADLNVVEKGRKAKIPMKGGGSYEYDFADIADVVKLTRPRLADHGVVALTPVHAYGDGLACTVTLLHSSGDRLDLGPFPFPHGRDAQATGSMVTYHRRYALVAALGIAAGDDDDGASAHRAAPAAPKWNRGMTKTELVNLLKGDKDEAGRAWEFASGDSLTEFGPEVAQRIADAWLGRPIDAGGGGVESLLEGAPPASGSEGPGDSLSTDARAAEGLATASPGPEEPA